MKNLIKPLGLALLATTVFYSCKKEDKTTTDPGNSNQITYDGDTYKLQTRAAFENYGTDDGSDPGFQYEGTSLDLYFIDQNIKLIVNGQGEIDTAYGQGLLLYFETFSSDPNKLANGTYTYDEDSPYMTNTFWLGFCPKNFDGSTGVVNPTFITGGSFTVSSENGVYTISFDLKDQNGSSITGTFKGRIDISNDYL